MKRYIPMKNTKAQEKEEELEKKRRKSEVGIQKKEQEHEMGSLHEEIEEENRATGKIFKGFNMPSGEGKL